VFYVLLGNNSIHCPCYQHWPSCPRHISAHSLRGPYWGICGWILTWIHPASASSIWSVRAPTCSCWCSPKGEIPSISIHVGDYFSNLFDRWVRLFLICNIIISFYLYIIYKHALQLICLNAGY